jgi:hypothetical protein
MGERKVAYERMGERKGKVAYERINLLPQERSFKGKVAYERSHPTTFPWEKGTFHPTTFPWEKGTFHPTTFPSTNYNLQYSLYSVYKKIGGRFPLGYPR